MKRQFRTMLCFTWIYCPGFSIDNIEKKVAQLFTGPQFYMTIKGNIDSSHTRKVSMFLCRCVFINKNNNQQLMQKIQDQSKKKSVVQGLHLPMNGFLALLKLAVHFLSFSNSHVCFKCHLNHGMLLSQLMVVLIFLFRRGLMFWEASLMVCIIFTINDPFFIHGFAHNWLSLKQITKYAGGCLLKITKIIFYNLVGIVVWGIFYTIGS